MTLGYFRKNTSHLPDNLDLMFEQTNDEFRFSMVNEASVESVEFKEDPQGPVLGVAVCLVIRD